MTTPNNSKSTRLKSKASTPPRPLQTLRDGARFSARRARKVIRFVATLYRAISLELPRFQRRLIARLYGNLNASGYRRYRRVYYSTPRKNAKSTLAAALAIFHLFADGESSPRIYLVATTLEQTREAFEIITRMIAAVPILDANTRVVDSANRKEVTRLKDGKKVGYIAALTSRGSKEGKNPSVVIADELCDWAELHRPLWNSMTMGSFARKQPLFIVTTTAGTNNSTLAREQYEYARKVQDGTVQDDQFLPFVIEADPAKWDDPAEQIRVNPLVAEGYIDEESIRAEYLQAQAGPEELAKFKNKRTNCWIGSTIGYFDMAKWNAQTEVIDQTALVGLPCVAGLDLSSRDDMTALVLVFGQRREDNTTKFYCLPYFWIPSEGIYERQRADGQNYEAWISKGQVYLSEGATIDHHLVLDKLKELSATFNIKQVSFDERGAEYLVTDVERAGFTVSPHAQGFRGMSEPLKELHLAVKNGLFVHGNHPVLTWHAANTNVRTNDANGIRPIKPPRKSKAGKIDGIVAATMAISTLMRHMKQATRKSAMGWFFEEGATTPNP